MLKLLVPLKKFGHSKCFYIFVRRNGLHQINLNVNHVPLKGSQVRHYRLSPALWQGTSEDDETPKKEVPTSDKVDAKVVAKIKSSLTYDHSMKSVKYITPLRAMKQYMLTYADMETLPKYYSRSPYSYETKTLVFRRSDVENLAHQKHGGPEVFEMRLKIAREVERKQEADLFNMKKALKYFRSGTTKGAPKPKEKTESILQSGAGRVVLSAVAINGINCAMKGIAWWYTGSKSMFSEMMHSFADTLNQIILAFGLHRSLKKPDDEHPYGYHPLRNVSSLISGVGIFFLGSGLSIYQGILGIVQPESIQSLFWALVVMGGSLFSEGATLMFAYQHASTSAAKQGVTLREYILEGGDPSTNVVLLEDCAAVLGVTVASTCMGLSHLTGSPLPDAIGALMIGGILAGVAYFIVWSNAQALMGKSIAPYKKEAIMRIVEKHKIIRGTYDIKATMMGADYVRFKTEVDIDGRELTRRYLETVPLDILLKELEAVKTQDDAVHFMLKHGDNIVNILGAEINKIEESIKAEFPTVKHIDIEIN